MNYFIDEEIPCRKVNLQITGLPENTLVLSSMIHNHDLDNQQFVVPPVPRHNVNNWLNQKMQNALYKLTPTEYSTLHSELRKNVSYDDTQKNIFNIDYLFNELLEHDPTNTIIKPEMINSFRKLALITSSKK